LNVLINVHEGERTKSGDNHLLGSFTLSGHPYNVISAEDKSIGS